jgi:hypothetical protein
MRRKRREVASHGYDDRVLVEFGPVATPSHGEI